MSKPFLQPSYQDVNGYHNIVPLSLPSLNSISLQISENRLKKLDQLENNAGVSETPQISDGQIIDQDVYFRIPGDNIIAYRNIHRWYMKSSEFLLAERVIDGVCFLYRQQRLREQVIHGNTKEAQEITINSSILH